MSQTNTTIIEELLIQVMEGIVSSAIIPESHKIKYVDYIEKNGLSEKMFQELEKIFSQENSEIEKELSEKLELISGLEQVMAEEMAKNDVTQAEIVVAVENYTDQKSQEVSESLQEIEKGMNAAIEEIGQEAEAKKIEDIRAKLQQK